MYRFATVLTAATLAGCASMTPTVETESAYLIYDIQPATINRAALLDAITKAVQQHATRVRVSRDIPPVEPPEKPGRFVLKDPFANSQMGMLMAANGQSTKVPVCNDAVLTIASADTHMQKHGERTEFFLCVLPYKQGHQVNIYTSYSKASGAFSVEVLGGTLARSIAGDSRQFIPRAIHQVKLAAEGVGGQVSVVDSYIPESFKGPFVDNLHLLQK